MQLIELFNIIRLHKYIFLYKILIIVFFIKIFVIINKRKNNITLLWLIVIIIYPYIAMSLYILLKIKKCINKNKLNFLKLKKNNYKIIKIEGIRHAICTVLVNQNIPSPTNNNCLMLYTKGTEAFQALMNEIEKARKTIYISTYVFKNDCVTRKLLKKLTEKAKSGVKVKILIDALGAYKVYFCQKIFKLLKKAGGKVYFFMPIIQMPFCNYINFRNHRKIYLFDEKKVFTGSMNLGNEYMGPTPCKKRWKDLLFSIQGQSTNYFSSIFVSDWQYTTKEKIKINLKNNKKYGNNILQIVPSGPDVPNNPLYTSIIAGIYAAKKRIWIVTPYFIPSDSLMEALKIAHYRNVDVKLITPKISNHVIADLARNYYIRKLKTIGIDIMLFNKKMLHAKAILFDDQAVMLGSVNLDNRSLFLNYEIVTFAYDKTTINKINQWMQNVLIHSTSLFPKSKYFKKVGEHIVKFITPLL